MSIKIKFPLIPLNVTLSKVQPSGVVRDKNYNKVFVIGFNKTGTTTLKRILKLWGFKIGDQRVASMMIEDYASNRLDRIFKLVETADAFQDVPFSLPGLYKELDHQFPNSKFILSVRDNGEQWYNSLLKFHSKKVGKLPPTAADIATVNNIYRGWLLDFHKIVYDYPEKELYDKRHLIKKYTKHIEDAENYFNNRPKNFMKINVSKTEDFFVLVKFLNVKTSMKDFLWMNKTKS